MPNNAKISRQSFVGSRALVIRDQPLPRLGLTTNLDLLRFLNRYRVYYGDGFVKDFDKSIKTDRKLAKVIWGLCQYILISVLPTW